MATGGAPAGLGSIAGHWRNVIEREQIPDAAVFTMTDENGYGGMGSRCLLKPGRQIISDCLADIKVLLPFVQVTRKLRLMKLRKSGKN